MHTIFKSVLCKRENEHTDSVFGFGIFAYQLKREQDGEETSEELNKIYNGIMACDDFIYLIYSVR